MALRYRLFRIGKMPAPVRQVSQAHRPLVSAEGLSVSSMATSVRLPGMRRTGKGWRLMVGSAVLLSHRILLAVGRHPILDSEVPPNPEGQHRLTVLEDGVRLEIEVPSIFPEGAGTVVLHYRTQLGHDVLSQLGGEWRVSVDGAISVLIRSWA